jgi:hypothetical protein
MFINSLIHQYEFFTIFYYPTGALTEATGEVGPTGPTAPGADYPGAGRDHTHFPQHFTRTFTGLCVSPPLLHERCSFHIFFRYNPHFSLFIHSIIEETLTYIPIEMKSKRKYLYIDGENIN